MYTGYRVLVVDDEPLIASLVADWLTDLACEVVGPVNTAAMALEAAARSTPHVALLDVSLGETDSYALADALAAKGIAIAFVTGHDAGSLPPERRSTPVLGKPFDFEAIKTLLARLVGTAAPPPAT